MNTLGSKEILVLSKRYLHHSHSSGFERLLDYLYCTSIERRPLGLISRLAKKTIHRYWQKDPNLIEYFYQYGDFVAEQRAFLYTWVNHTQITHVLYGDEQLDLLIKRRRLLRSRLVATFHLPFDRSANRFKAHHTIMAKSIDHFVAVSSDLASHLADLFGEKRVSFIPHGIDTDRFREIQSRPISSEKLKLLVVGWHMRDLGMIHELADLAQYNSWNVEFEYVGPSSSFVFFSGCRNVSLFCDISEDDLILKYQTADSLLLPLLSSTANNSILESLACGTPVISTNVGGVIDYVNPSAGWLLPKGDFSSLAELVQHLIRNRNQCTAKRAAARRSSLQYDWRNIAKQYIDLYAHVIET